MDGCMDGCTHIQYLQVELGISAYTRTMVLWFESPHSVYQQHLRLLPLAAWALSTPPSSHIEGEMKW